MSCLLTNSLPSIILRRLSQVIISVNGFEEAKAYPVMYNSSELLMDNTKDVFYIKAVDGMGKYTINSYKFEQVENERPLTAADKITTEHIKDLQNQKKK